MAKARKAAPVQTAGGSIGPKNGAAPPKLFWPKVLVLVALIVVTARFVPHYHRDAQASGPPRALSSDGSTVPPSPAAALDSDRHSSVRTLMAARGTRDVCPELFSSMALVTALAFTVGFALLQYVIPGFRPNNAVSPRTAVIVVTLFCGVAILIYDLLAADAVLLERAPLWLSWLFPYWKNCAVAIIAAIFLYVDHSETLFKPSVEIDKIVLSSIVLSSLFAGAVGDLLGAGFMHAYNTGSVSFHLIIGTLLFEPGAHNGKAAL
ncbi:MAG: hypothetical protein KJ067_14015 [Vicinamibacteria bacterium]|nr:hypothetical protein [Vicinamibacteria bacterium]